MTELIVNESAIKIIEDETLVALSEIIGVTRSDMEKVKTRVHYDTGPGLGFKDLAADAEDAYCASWLESFQRLSTARSESSRHRNALTVHRIRILFLRRRL